MNGKLILLGCGTALLLLLPACAAQERSTEFAVTAADMAALDRLYADAIREPQYRRALRKPVRNAHRRARRHLAEQAEALRVQAGDLPRAMALTGADNAKVLDDWKDALAALASAARRGDDAELRSAYTRATASQYRLESRLSPAKP